MLLVMSHSTPADAVKVTSREKTVRAVTIVTSETPMHAASPVTLSFHLTSEYAVAGNVSYKSYYTVKPNTLNCLPVNPAILHRSRHRLWEATLVQAKECIVTDQY